MTPTRPRSCGASRKPYVRAIADDPARAPVTAVADLSFLATNDYAQQRKLTDELIARHIAGRIDAFASWNTVANTIGTALPEAVAVVAGRRLGTYDPRAHATFTLMRYVDDIAFHVDVRPQLNDDLSAQGVSDHTYLLPDVARGAASENRAKLWRDGLGCSRRSSPHFAIAASRSRCRGTARSRRNWICGSTVTRRARFRDRRCRRCRKGPATPRASADWSGAARRT